MKFYIKFDLIYFGLFFTIKSIIYCNKIENKFKKTKKVEPEVWLTVSSLTDWDSKLNKQIERQLELNWRDAPNNSIDIWIGLFNEEPKDNKLVKNDKNASIEWFSTNGQISGTHRTSVQFPYKKFSKKNLHLKCLKYWTALIKSNRILAKNCLKINPFWMENHLKEIGNQSLMDLMIAGTHNSGSYDKFILKEDTLYNKYSLCQDENIFNQLVYGIRFLDLRVAYDRQDGQKYKLWIVHGPVIMKHSLDSVLAQVKRFIELAPKEIVILDFHRLEKGFNKEEETPQLLKRHHRKVMALIIKHLNKYIIPQKMGLNSTLNELIAKNKRVVIGYESDHYLVHPRAKHLWPNTDDVEEMIEFFNEAICDYYPNQLVSAMTQLTPERISLIIDRYDGLRTMAHNVNRIITDAFSSGGNRDWSRCVNVVSTDYFLGNNIIEISIKTNLKRNTH